MSKPQISKGKSQYALFASVVVVILLFILALMYVAVMQNKNMRLMQVSIEHMQQDVQKIAKIATQPTLMDNPEKFNAAVIGAFEGYVAAQQDEAIRAKEQAYSAALEQVLEGKHIYGDLNARFTLVEFSDMECPYCKRFHDTPKRIVDESEGLVNWQWKHLPLSFHNPVAHRQAQASECVAEIGGNRKFWMFLEEIFRESRGGGQGVPNLMGLVKAVGVDEAALRECMESGKHQATVDDDVNQATKFGINGTPATFIVDNTTGKSQLLSGAQPAEAFITAIRKMAAEEAKTN